MKDMPEYYLQQYPRINIHDPDDLRRWATRLEISEGDLRDIVEKIGPAADAVTEYLKSK